MPAMRFNVAGLREHLGLSQEKFAEKIGVHLRTVQRWEAHDVDPSPMAVKHMKSVLADAATHPDTPASSPSLQS